MIPKIIHYCWFGNSEKGKFIEYCISTWKFYNPDYQIIEWNEENFDTSLSLFTAKAFENKHWAYLSDYVRCYVLSLYGGVYLDTDVEVRGKFDSFLNNKAFSGFESIGFPFTAVWGAARNHIWPNRILEIYNAQKQYIPEINTQLISKFLIENYKVDPYSNVIQKLKDGITIYPTYYFCFPVEENFAIHHFNGSWIRTENDESYKEKIAKPFYRDTFLNFYKGDIIQELYLEGVIDRKEIKNFLKKRLLKKIKSIWRF